jgi:DUF1365 family protein
MRSSFYEGTVFHKRYVPKVHTLKYRVFNILIDLDELDYVHEKNRFFSVNRFNLISFHESDHGDPETANNGLLKTRIFDLLKSNDIDTSQIAKIELLTYPRILGFVFNPLTIIYCRSETGEIRSVIYEVRNTFGERHNYIYNPVEPHDIDNFHQAEKCFHVSPFFDTSGNYSFRLKEPGEKVAANIDYWAEREKRLTANFTGTRRELDNKSTLSLFFKLPFMTVKVVGGILFEALKLWAKGVKVFSHPGRHAYQSTSAVPAINQNQSNDTMDTSHD